MEAVVVLAIIGVVLWIILSGDDSEIRERLKSNIETGKRLKKTARSSGAFIEVDFDNLFDLTTALAAFFKYKKHEWVAICFVDDTGACRRVWINKGDDRKRVALGLQPSKAIECAQSISTDHILIAHNHPVSSLDRPDYGSREENIEAHFAHKAGVLGFSEQDRSTDDLWRSACQNHGLGYGASVYAAGSGYHEFGEQLETLLKESRPFPEGTVYLLD